MRNENLLHNRLENECKFFYVGGKDKKMWEQLGQWNGKEKWEGNRIKLLKINLNFNKN